MKEYKLEHDFQNKYETILNEARKLASNAKKYIIDNYKSITDWSSLAVTVIDGRGNNEVDYYNYDECPIVAGFKSNESLDSTLIKWRKERHNPVVSLTNCILDEIDDDFSLTINGVEFWWIDDKAVIDIADYIVRKLYNND